MRFHVVALPHTQTTSSYSTCAYTNKVVGFCKMMMARGHEVFLYAGEQNEAPCTELITCISEAKRAEVVGDKPYVEASFDYSLPHWQMFNADAAHEIHKRRQPKDFLCLIGGLAQKQIADALPGMMAVEWGVGYGGVFSPYRVFESYAWMHMHYGAAAGNPTMADGKWYDAVIPGYLDPSDFPFEDRFERLRIPYDNRGRGPKGPHGTIAWGLSDHTADDRDRTKREKHIHDLTCHQCRKDDPYYLFIGRLVERKGFQTAIDTCKAIGARLVVAGPGTPPPGVDYVGVVNPRERGRLMAGAKAVFVPTQYIEPFGNVAIEAMCCGTPVITTDWGAFTETVIDGVTGFRCHTLGEFIDAAQRADTLDPATIRRHVVDNYSLDVIGAKYERYFNRLLGLWGEGWYGRAANDNAPRAIAA